MIAASETAALPNSYPRLAARVVNSSTNSRDEAWRFEKMGQGTVCVVHHATNQALGMDARGCAYLTPNRGGWETFEIEFIPHCDTYSLLSHPWHSDCYLGSNACGKGVFAAKQADLAEHWCIEDLHDGAVRLRNNHNANA